MIVKKLPKRLYSIEDSRMLAYIERIYYSFLDDRMDFANKFTTFTQEWADEFGQEIETVSSLPRDGSYRASIAITTEDLNEKRAFAADKLRELFGYVALAFGDIQKSKAFGKDRLGEALYSYDKMMALLERAYGQANEPENKAVLNAKGYTNFQISALQGLRSQIENLIETRNGQEAARYEATRARIEGMNTIYERVREINTAAKVVYMDDAAMKGKYKLTPPRKPGPKKKKKADIGW